MRFLALAGQICYYSISASLCLLVQSKSFICNSTIWIYLYCSSILWFT